jgi:hypothetical protein
VPWPKKVAPYFPTQLISLSNGVVVGLVVIVVVDVVVGVVVTVVVRDVVGVDTEQSRNPPA